MRQTKFSILALTAAVTLALSGSAWADTIAYWNFNNNTQGTPSSNLGTFNTSMSGGTLGNEVYNSTDKTLSSAYGVNSSSSFVDLSHLSGSMGLAGGSNNWGTFAGDATVNANALNGDVSGGALSVVGTANNYVTNSSYVEFKLPTTGYQGIVLSYATRGTATGFATQEWDYSTDGTNWTNYSTISGRNVTAWSLQTVSFPSALDNLANAYFRVALGGATSSSGNNRFDNVQFNASAIPAVPEPGTLALLGAGLAVAAVAFARRKVSK